VLTHAALLRAPARVSGEVEDSLIAPAARVAGSISRSVIGRGAVVEAGAVVRESVLLPGAVVRSGATVVRAVLDDDVEVCPDVSVGEDGGEIALVGLRASVKADIAAGARHPEVDDDT
jgi:glucose-1-phosphate adenylyltransferase